MWKPALAGLGCLVPHADHGEAEHWGCLVVSGWLCFATLGYRTQERSRATSQGMLCWRWCVMSPGRNPALFSSNPLSILALPLLLLLLAPVPGVSPA